jgi:hypothetical protein
MFNGKYWITPEGLVDVTLGEHAVYARRVMLKLRPDESLSPKEMLTPLTAAQRGKYAARGVPKDVLEFLSRPNGDGMVEPRIYAIREYGWVRTRKEGLWVWRQDERTLWLIRDAKEFWARQSHLKGRDGVDVVQLSDRGKYYLTLRELRDPKLTARALKALPGRRSPALVTD